MDLRSSAGPLVGREKELEHLDAALDALDGGAAACLTVEGEPGIGKTRLLAELRARAEERGHVVLSGAAAEFERELPFSVWVDALDAYVASQELAEHEAGTPTLASELGQVLPVAADAPDGGRRRSPTSATAPTARSAACSSCSPTTSRSCSCSTTCTGATARRSS